MPCFVTAWRSSAIRSAVASAMLLSGRQTRDYLLR